MKPALGALETRLFAYAQMRGWRTVRTGQLVAPLGLTQLQERELLRRLSRGRLIARVRRGLYLLPPKLPLGGLWTPDPILALDALIADRRGRYQICGPNAFLRYGFDNQVPNRLYAYNNRISGMRRVGAALLTLIKVSDVRLGDVEEEPGPEGTTAIYSSRARTLVDAVYDWSRFSGLPRAYRWIREELRTKRVGAEELVTRTLRYGDTGTRRRMGTVLEQAGLSEALVKKIERRVPQTRSPIPWVPTLPKRGPVNRRWGVVMNGEA